MLSDLTQQRRAAIHRRWLDQLVDSYPDETARFLRRQDDPFANPVGAAFTEGTLQVLDGVLDGGDDPDVASALDRIIRIRAVQDMAPADALSFVFDLKRAARDELGDEASPQWLEFDRRVDRVALLAFNVFVGCREQVFAIRVDAIRNQSLKMMERLNEWRSQRRSDAVAPAGSKP